MRKVILISTIIIFIALFIKGNKENLNNKWENSKFDLRDEIPIKIEYQIKATYNSCWIYAGLNSIETNLMLKNGLDFDFSESHVEYMTSKDFDWEREINSGGSIMTLRDYVQYGKGPVLERDVPNRIYNENEYDILINVKPIIKKVEIVEFDVKDSNLRTNVKKHIVKNGSVCGVIYFEPNEVNFYQKETYGYSNLYNEYYNHMVSIIGWDDNYSKENFPESNRPKEDGAYIAMTFYKAFENDHIIYISYEDKTIEKYMSGIVECELYD